MTRRPASPGAAIALAGGAIALVLACTAVLHPDTFPFHGDGDGDGWDAAIVIDGASAVSYADIRDGSGVLTFAESALPERLAPRRAHLKTAGHSLVDPSRVVGAWRLPNDDGGSIGTLVHGLGNGGRIEESATFRDGQTWRARYRAADGTPLLLLYIDGTHPAFARDQPEALRPAPERYLIAYADAS